MILPVDGVFEEYPALYLKKEESRLGYNGNPFSIEALQAPVCIQGPARIYDHEKKFIGLYEFAPERKQYRLIKMFYEK